MLEGYVDDDVPDVVGDHDIAQQHRKSELCVGIENPPLDGRYACLAESGIGRLDELPASYGQLVRRKVGALLAKTGHDLALAVLEIRVVGRRT